MTGHPGFPTANVFVVIVRGLQGFFQVANMANCLPFEQWQDHFFHISHKFILKVLWTMLNGRTFSLCQFPLSAFFSYRLLLSWGSWGSFLQSEGYWVAIWIGTFKDEYSSLSMFFKIITLKSHHTACGSWKYQKILFSTSDKQKDPVQGYLHLPLNSHNLILTPHYCTKPPLPKFAGRNALEVIDNVSTSSSFSTEFSFKSPAESKGQLFSSITALHSFLCAEQSPATPVLLGEVHRGIRECHWFLKLGHFLLSGRTDSSHVDSDTWKHRICFE